MPGPSERRANGQLGGAGRRQRQSVYRRADWADLSRDRRDTYGGSGSFDAIFNVGLVPANLPSINQFTLSPTNNVFVGTLVPLAASVTVSQPIHFQWLFNNGGGFAALPGTGTNTLVLNAAVTDHRLVMSWC